MGARHCRAAKRPEGSRKQRNPNHWIVGSIPTRRRCSARTTTDQITFAVVPVRTLLTRFSPDLCGNVAPKRCPNRGRSTAERTTPPQSTPSPICCAKLVELADDILATEPWTRAGEDARRLFRVTVREMEMRADSSRDPLVIAVVYDPRKIHERCPDLFHQAPL